MEFGYDVKKHLIGNAFLWWSIWTTPHLGRLEWPTQDPFSDHNNIWVSFWVIRKWTRRAFSFSLLREDRVGETHSIVSHTTAIQNWPFIPQAGFSPTPDSNAREDKNAYVRSAAAEAVARVAEQGDQQVMDLVDSLRLGPTRSSYVFMLCILCFFAVCFARVFV